MKTIVGKCHCGAVEFEVDIENEFGDLRRCNCSLCRRKGAIMAGVTVDRLRVTHGADNLSLYQWNTKIAKHYFCRTCGIYTHHQRRSDPNQYGFNVGCLEGYDQNELGHVPVGDGASMSLVSQPSTMNVDTFQNLLKPVTDFVVSQVVNSALAEELDRRFPPSGDIFNAIERACHESISDGWMCAQGTQGRRFGRIIEPCEETGGLSVDVVELTDFVGPHHRHPTGEICMVMPVTEAAQFDGTARGWCVFAPGSDHRPTVTGGEAIVLYMLPGGKIEFSEHSAG